MLELGTLKLDATPKIAVGFADQIRAHDVADAKRAGVDIAEIRIDQFRLFKPAYVIRVLNLFKGFPTIATIRIREEKGHWSGSESERIDLFTSILPHVDGVDVELRATEAMAKVGRAAQQHGKLFVASHHDYDTTPSFSVLERRIRDAKKAGADIVKIATQVNEPQDAQVLTAVLQAHAKENLIVIGMGAKGTLTRVFFPALGSLMTFASILGRSTAPGQLPFKQMFDLIRIFYPAYNEEKIIKLKLLECA